MNKNGTGEPTRIADVIGGHIHPAICVTQNGTLLAVYNKEGGGGKELLLSRSDDGGVTWTRSTPIPTIRNCSIYPGSLATLSDGRVLLNWSCYHKTEERLWRVPQFSISADGGETWSETRDYPITDHTNYTCMRHAPVEWSTDTWMHVRSMTVPCFTIWERIRLRLLAMDAITVWCRLCAPLKGR